MPPPPMVVMTDRAISLMNLKCSGAFNQTLNIQLMKNWPAELCSQASLHRALFE